MPKAPVLGSNKPAVSVSSESKPIATSAGQVKVENEPAETVSPSIASYASAADVRPVAPVRRSGFAERAGKYPKGVKRQDVSQTREVLNAGERKAFNALPASMQRDMEIYAEYVADHMRRKDAGLPDARPYYPSFVAQSIKRVADAAKEDKAVNDLAGSLQRKTYGHRSMHGWSKPLPMGNSVENDFMPVKAGKVQTAGKNANAPAPAATAADGINVAGYGKRFSLSEDAESAFAKAVDAAAEGNPVKGYINLGSTPDALKAIGLPSVKVTMHGSVFKKVMGGKHNLTKEAMKQLPAQLNNPVAVMGSSFAATKQDGYVVLTELVERENGNDKPVIAALHLKQDANGIRLLNIASVYGRRLSQLQSGLDKELKYWNKDKGLKFVKAFGLRLPAYASTDSALAEHNIKTDADLKQDEFKFSRSDDALKTEYDKAKEAGETELTFRQWQQVRTPEFKAWFGDWENDPDNASKVVNPRTGEPLVVYHGTEGEFNTFKVNPYDPLIFFTDNKELGEAYLYRREGIVFETFLNIRNPDTVDAEGNFYGSFPDPNSGDFVSTNSFSSRARENGYDGAIISNVQDAPTASFDEIVSNVFVVFQPNQIKSATDNTGAFDAGNDDIRFSRSAMKSIDANIKRGKDVMKRTKAQSLEKLRRSESIRISGNEIPASSDLRQYKRNALEYGKTLRGTYTNKDTGQEIALGLNAVKEVLQHDYKDPSHLQSISAIPEIIENAVYVGTFKNEDIDKRPKIQSYDYYLAGLNIGGQDYTVRAVVANADTGERYYDHKLTGIEKGELLSTAGITNPSFNSASPSSVINDKRLLQILQDDNQDGAGRVGFDTSAATRETPTLTRRSVGASDTGSNIPLSENTRHSRKTAKQADGSTAIRKAVRQAVGAANMRHVDIISYADAAKADPQNAEDLLTAQGWYDAKDKRVTLVSDNLTAREAAFTAWHELGHRNIDVSGFDNWKNLLRNAYKGNRTLRNIAHKVREQRSGMNDAAARNDYVAVEEAAVELYAAWKNDDYAMIKEKYGVSVPMEIRGSRLQQFFAKLFDAMRTILKRNIGTDKFSNAQLVDLMRRIDKAKPSGRVSVGGNVAGYGKRFSLSEDAESAFAKAVDDVAAGRKPKQQYIPMGTTPEALKLAGMPDTRVLIRQDVLKKVMGGKHNIAPEILKHLPEQLNNPVAVMKSAPQATHQGYVALTELQERGEPVIAALHLKVNKHGTEVANIASIYGKNLRGLQNMLNHDLVYWHTEKGRNLVSSFGLQLPANIDAQGRSLSKSNIKTEADLSQAKRFNRSDDALKTEYDKAKEAGETELTFRQWQQVRTPEFKAWFGDWENDPKNASKVVNPRTGEPLVVYHGTSSYGFNIFNSSKLSGIYFSDSKEVAGSYVDNEFRKVYETFLNIRNADVIDFNGSKWDKYVSPKLRTTGKYIVINQYNEFEARFDNKEQAEKYAEKYTDSDEDFILSVINEENADDVQDIPNGKQSYSTTEELAVLAKSKGKDGSIFRNTSDNADYELDTNSNIYVVFDSNQIKSATDNTGAFDAGNDDIRFSRKADTRRNYEKRIDELFNSAKAERFGGVTVLDRADVLDMLGYGNMPLRLVEGKVIAGKTNHPLMTADVWKKIPDWVDAPAMVFDSDTVEGRLVFIAPEKVRGNDVRIVVEPNGGELQAHMLVNAYDKDTSSPYLRWANDRLLRYVDKAKAARINERFGLRLPDILKNPSLAPNAQIHRMGRGNTKDLRLGRILTEKNLQGYRNRNPLDAEPLKFARSSKKTGKGETIAHNLAGTINAVANLDRNVFAKAKQAADGKRIDLLGIGLQGLGRRQIVDIYGDMIPELHNYDNLADRFGADGNMAAVNADKVVTDWGRLKDADALADLMHDATLAKIDADPKVAPPAHADKEKAAELMKRFSGLSEDAQRVYRKARDDYKEHFDQVQQALKERMKRLGVQRDVFQAMEQRFFDALQGVYFPLARFGKYVVAVKSDNGKVISISRAETMGEAEAVRKSFMERFPASKGFEVGRVMLDKEYSQSRDSVGRGFMKELFDALENINLDMQQFADIEDTLSQLYLNSVPDLSWAKHGIHRKGTAGYSDDARRAYAQNMFHGASYLAKLRYGDLMEQSLLDMQKQVDAKAKEDKNYKQPEAQRVIDEMVKRHEAVMNPKSNKISTALTSFGFLYYLGLSPASAAVNLSQTALVAYPVMAAKWGAVKAGKALLAASKQAASKKGGYNNIRETLNDDEKAAFDRAVSDGVVDVSQAHDLAGIAQGEDAGVLWKTRRVMQAASWLFHQAELFNRQVTFIAAYRLAKAQHGDSDKAFAEAKKATYDGHFDYSAQNRPRFMTGNVAKVVFLFKQYSQNMIYTVSRNAYLAAKGDKQARKTFAGLMVTHALAAGVLGLPAVSVLLSAASWLGSDDDEPWDAEAALRNQLAEIFGKKGSEVISKGVSRLTPLDISGRVGLNNLIFPDIQEGLQGARAAESFAAGMMGPVLGIGTNFVKGVNLWADGDYKKGLEQMLPVSVRNPLKSYRLAVDGHVDRSGIVVKDDFSAAEIAGQALGFSPSDLRLKMEGKGSVYRADRAVRERRTELMQRMAKAVIDKDREKGKEIQADIASFNRKNPNMRITPQHVSASVKSRIRRIAEAKNGLYLPKNRRQYMEAGDYAFDG